MNYYNEIKNEIIDIETYKKVKDYSKNKRKLKKELYTKQYIQQYKELK